MEHEFYSCGLSCLNRTRQLVRVLSQRTRHIDSASQWNRSIAQLRLLSNTGSWYQVQQHDKWTSFSLLRSFVPAYQHVSILRSPYLVRLRFYWTISLFLVCVVHFLFIVSCYNKKAQLSLTNPCNAFQASRSLCQYSDVIRRQ